MTSNLSTSLALTVPDALSRIYRNRANMPISETVVQLGFDRRELRIETCKSHFHGGVSTRAKVV